MTQDMKAGLQHLQKHISSGKSHSLRDLQKHAAVYENMKQQLLNMSVEIGLFIEESFT
jgi:hypothetical protein